jgi:polar amino acid transport system ATP-binding protein
VGEPLIRVRGLRKSYGDNEVLRDIDVDIARGDVVSIIGPSGCGKSTFIRCLNFLDPATKGEVWFDGKQVCSNPKDLQQLRRRMGMVFQSFNLFPTMTVVENAMLGPVNLLGLQRQQAYDRAMDLLEKVGLAHKALSYPDELSGGQKQRAAIARTLAMQPDVVLFDEPTSALDPTMVGEVMGVVKMLAMQGATMLIVTHEMNFAKHVANRVFYMDEKGIYEDASPEQVFEHPARPKTRDFIFHVRNFSYAIDPSAFDFFELFGQAGVFMRKELLGDERILRVTHVLEEAVYHVALPALGAGGATLNLCYTGKTDELWVTIRDDAGTAAFSLEGVDEAALRILRGYAKSMECLPGLIRIEM